jgi:micrococcal nuclease
VYEYKAKVDRVVDGDTVDFIVDLGFNVNIKIRTRLVGVDTPERGHEDWTKAKDMCQDLLYESAGIHNPDGFPVETEVIIRTNKTGKYGRWLVEIDGVTDELAKTWPYDR